MRVCLSKTWSGADSGTDSEYAVRCNGARAVIYAFVCACSPSAKGFTGAASGWGVEKSLVAKGSSEEIRDDIDASPELVGVG